MLSFVVRSGETAVTSKLPTVPSLIGSNSTMATLPTVDWSRSWLA
jgi:hypothetical protein